MKIKAIIPAAGLGTRFAPITKTIPKEMLPLGTRPLLEYSIQELLSAGIKEIIVIISSRKDLIKDYFSDYSGIHFVYQKEALGLGHAINCAKDFFNNQENALVLLPDELFLPQEKELSPTQQLISHFQEFQSSAVSLLEVPREKVSSYGIAKLGDNNKITNLVEKPAIEKAPSNFALPGRYILKPEIWPALENLARGAGGEYQLTDALIKIMNQSTLYGIPTQAKRFDTGNVNGWFEANEFFMKNQKALKT